jgi:hypothetical protein
VRAEGNDDEIEVKLRCAVEQCGRSQQESAIIPDSNDLCARALKTFDEESIARVVIVVAAEITDAQSGQYQRILMAVCPRVNNQA